MRTGPLVLIACAPSEVRMLEALVPQGAEIITAESMEGAVEQIAQGIDAIVCSTEFDDSRMLDLVQEVHLRWPDIPVLCCRASGNRMSEATLRAAALAALSIGVAAFLDLANSAASLSPDVGELAATLLRLLG